MPDLTSWVTSITRVEDSVIEYRGRPIQEIISELSFEELVWLLLTGKDATEPQRTAIRYSLLAAADHGLAAPSVASARINASTRGNLVTSVAVGLIAFGGPSHGGAAEESASLFTRIVAQVRVGVALAEAVTELCGAILDSGLRVPGYGHPYHSVDPRIAQLLDVMPESRDHRDAALAVAEYLSDRLKKPLKLNADAAVSSLLLDAGLEAGQVCLITAIGRSAGLAAHVWEEHQREAPFRAPAIDTVLYEANGADPGIQP